jgi:hypothetical protein
MLIRIVSIYPNTRKLVLKVTCCQGLQSAHTDHFETTGVCEHKTITAGEKKLHLTQNMKFWFVANEAVSYKIIPYFTGQCKLVCF